MRLFVAVDLPPQLKEALERQVAAPLRPRLPAARWTRPEGRHLTLRFLGEVAEGLVGRLRAALGEAAGRHAPFEAAFESLGAFPSLRRARVLWVGVGEGREALAALAAEVEQAAAGLGFEAERRPFAAHLTLARFKVPTPLGHLEGVTVPAQPFPVAEVVLFRSQLHPQGAIYTALDRFPLR